MLGRNKCTIVGNLTKDIELKQGKNGKSYTNFTLAVNSGKDRPAIFLDFVAFGKTAENAPKFLHKGSSALVDGRIQAEMYVAKDGSKRKSWTIVADVITGLDKKPKGENAPATTVSAPVAESTVDTTSDEEDELF